LRAALAERFPVSPAPVAEDLDTPECSGRGGTKLTLVNDQNVQIGTAQFVCDGAKGATGDVGPAGSGVTGQQSQVFFSNALKSTNTASCDTTQPGASQNIHPNFPVTITVPPNVDVLIEAEGAIAGTNQANVASTYNHYLVIDNSRGTPLFGTKQTTSTGNGSIAVAANWSLVRKFTMSPGPHTLALCSLFVTGGSLSNYAGPTDSPLQSSITVTFIAR
jgi:hypothetical protein